jgi:hypothetical protein
LGYVFEVGYRVGSRMGQEPHFQRLWDVEEIVQEVVNLLQSFRHLAKKHHAMSKILIHGVTDMTKKLGDIRL